MKSTNPKLVILLVLVIALVGYSKISNPHKKYSQQAFWVSATVDDVYAIPSEALLPGNKNGPVLLWAATTTTDPEVIAALVARGAGINEQDAGIIFSGTPLSAAAGFNTNPLIIDELIKLGAEIGKVVGTQDKTALIIAAEINPVAAIVERLINNGADTAYRDLTGRNALEQAIKFKNESVLGVLRTHTR